MAEFLQIRLSVGKRLFGTLGPTLVKVSPNRVIKGPCDTTELEALEYVAKNTSIPIPKVLNSYHRPEGLYIELGYVSGKDLQYGWIKNRLSPEEKRNIIQELSGYIDQLRSLTPPKAETVGSAGLCEFLDHRIGSAPCRPFETHDEFHSFLRRHIPLEQCTQVFGKDVTTCHTRKYRSTFTHGDLSPRNIIVRKGRVVAIIDWEFAGWYPEYWEYTKANFAPLNWPDWYEDFGNSLRKYEDELAAERILWRRCDQPGEVTDYSLPDDSKPEAQ